MENKRIAYLDMVKGIGIILVVAGHSGYLPHNVLTVVTSFHMPLFFIVSGMLIRLTGEEQRPFRQLLSRKLKNLMLPYGIFSLVYLLIYGGYFHYISGSLTARQIQEYIIQAVSLDGISVLWFLSALFFAQIFFLGIRKIFFLRKRTKSGKISSIAVCMVAALSACCLKPWVFGMLSAETLWEQWFMGVMYLLFRAAAGTGFLALGYVTMEGLERLDRLKASRKPGRQSGRELAAGFLCLILTAFLSLYNGICDLRYMQFHSLPIFLLCAYLGTMGIVFLCRGIPVWKWLCFLGANSLIIMLTHLDCQYMLLSIRAGEFLASLFPPAAEFLLYPGIILGMTGLELGTIYMVTHIRGVLGRKHTGLS